MQVDATRRRTMNSRGRNESERHRNTSLLTNFGNIAIFCQFE